MCECISYICDKDVRVNLQPLHVRQVTCVRAISRALLLNEIVLIFADF